MRNVHIDGLKMGTNAICTVIMQKIENCNEESTKEELLISINNVKEFCKVSLGKK